MVPPLFFLERFGLKDLAELPTVRELEELEAVSQTVAIEDSSSSDSDFLDESLTLAEQVEVENLSQSQETFDGVVEDI